MNFTEMDTNSLMILKKRAKNWVKSRNEAEKHLHTHRNLCGGSRKERNTDIKLILQANKCGDFDRLRFPKMSLPQTNYRLIN